MLAVDDVSLEVAHGEFFTLLGPSGCGKTSTLRLIAGFERLDGGTITLDGTDIGGKPPHKRPVNTVFQSYALFPHMTVAENVAFGLRYKRVSKSEVARRVGEAMELVQLGALAERRPGQLSGGQQQRVALARALVLEPPVLLLDEPLGALDARLRIDLQVELKRIQETLEITFVYVTHDQDEALTMSDRVAVMKGGRVEQCDEPRVLYEEPHGVRGELPRLLEPDPRGGRRGWAEGGGVHAARRRRRAQRAALAMIRPERVRLEPHGSGGENRVPGWSRPSSTSASTRTCGVRLASGALVRCDVPTDGEAVEHSPATPCACTCPPSCCGCWSREAARGVLGAARRVIGRDGFAAATVGTITREAGASLGLLNYHFGVQGRGGRGGVRGGGPRGPRGAGGDLAAPRGPPGAAGRYLDQSEWADTASWRLWVDAWGSSVHSPLVRDTLGRFDIGWRAVLAEVLADGVRQGCWVRRRAGHRGAAGGRAGRDRIARDRPRRRRAAGPRRGVGTAPGGAGAGRAAAVAAGLRAAAGRRRCTRWRWRSARVTSTPAAPSILPCCSRSWRRRGRPGSATACPRRSSRTSPSATCGRWRATTSSVTCTLDSAGRATFRARASDHRRRTAGVEGRDDA